MHMRYAMLHARELHLFPDPSAVAEVPYLFRHFHEGAPLHRRMHSLRIFNRCSLPIQSLIHERSDVHS